MNVNLTFSIENILKDDKRPSLVNDSADDGSDCRTIKKEERKEKLDTRIVRISGLSCIENYGRTSLLSTVTHHELCNINTRCSCVKRVTTPLINVREKLKTRRIGHPYKSRAPPKRKAFRNAFTHTQIMHLEALFGHTKYLSSADRIRVAKELHMTDNQLKTWYQNRRTKLKRQLLEMKEQEKIIQNL